jgi:hypothetical protein
MLKGLIMKVNFMKLKFGNYFLPIFVVSSFFGTSALASEIPHVYTTVEKGMCSIEIDGGTIDNYKCNYFRAPFVLNYSYLYEADKQIFVLIDSPMGNACDGGPLHIYSKTEDGKFKPLKTIDFCRGHYPLITSGPETFIIKIPSISIDGTDKKIPAETWELKNDELVKR